ncbi:hypothetical protein J2787_000636 [Chryseobacterium rhizosphaerae]|uniref:RHS repeat protein n=1 Tax=Chryseobacterium rhizosphaerae TaxID=395937 RepID=A0AAE3Y859_9FLAO|nr:hypothetical protein [Chryseobacterium rhizosphaerae]MDR6525266.1 hypothetical protein [Chryseobacterium rhizosphaerae]
MKKNICTIAFLLASIKLLSQTSQSYPMNPRLDSYFGRTEFQFSNVSPFNVNEYNGTANIYIPLHMIKFNGLEIPIGIKYNSSGIKVDQLSSEVGLGWNIEAGGSVLKEINGKFEDNVPIKAGGGVNQTDAGYIVQTFTRDIPDFYSVTAPNVSGRFIIDNTFTVREIDNFKTCDIEYVRGIWDSGILQSYGHSLSDINFNKDTQSIKITKNKFTYSFNEWNHTDKLTYFYDHYYNGANYLVNSHSWSSTHYNTEYLLSELKDNTTEKKLIFNYLPISGEETNLSNMYSSKLDNTNKLNKNRIWDKIAYRNNDTGATTNNFSNKTMYSTYSSEGFIKKYIKEIITDDEIITFNYENSRDDLIIKIAPIQGQQTKAPYLKSIEIKNKFSNVVVTKYVFNYSYFNSNCSNSHLCKRLRLDSLDKFYNNVASYKESHTFNYFNTTALPVVGSNAKDPFGYKLNLAESVVSDGTDLPKRPNLYQYIDNVGGNNFYYFSTIKIPTLNPVKVAGEYEQITSSLDDTKAWSLTSINYPTGGIQSFDYEQNEFTWKGVPIKGAGLRIKSIKLTNGTSNEETQYKYTIGEVAALPIVTLKKSVASGPNSTVVSSIPQSFMPKLVTSNGSYVIYSKVEKILPNGGKIINNYTSFTDYPESDDVSYSFGGSIIVKNFGAHLFSNEKTGPSVYSNYSSVRGLLKSSYQYGSNNTLVKSTFNNYDITDFPFSIPIDNFDYHYNRELYSDLNELYPSIVNVKPVIKKVNLSNTNTVTKFGSNEVGEAKSFTYTNDYNLIKNVKITTPTDVYENNSVYAFENNSQPILNTPQLKQVKIEDSQLKNNKITSKIQTIYAKDNSTSNLTLPSVISSYDLNTQSMIEEVKYDVQNTQGNIVQYTQKNNVPVVIIWGYNNTKPIAKIEGAKLSDIQQSQIDSIVNSSNIDASANPNNSETSFLLALDQFRSNANLSGYSITTYTYDPLIGIRSITPPSGIRENYIYDSANRLQKIIDGNGYVLKEMKYNYKN